eukprot:4571642-Alexandrium_andersonii.AAC.1
MARFANKRQLGSSFAGKSQPQEAHFASAPPHLLSSSRTCHVGSHGEHCSSHQAAEDCSRAEAAVRAIPGSHGLALALRPGLRRGASRQCAHARCP